MVRRIIHIDEEKCNGCGACAAACHEGAIGMVDGKARLMRDDYCDGLGDCLPACPTGAITFTEREAAAYDEAAVLAAKAAKAAKTERNAPFTRPTKRTPDTQAVARGISCIVSNTTRRSTRPRRPPPQGIRVPALGNGPVRFAWFP